MCDHDHHGLLRRTVLGATAAAVAGLAGCLGGDEEATSAEPPDPVALDGSKACDVCGMVVSEGYGPNGQVFFEGDYPADRDGPAWYDSVRELYLDRFARTDRGDGPLATYVIDYAAFDYEVEAASGTFVEAAEAVFVVDSGIEGAMGPELLPFGRRAAAEAFVDAEGGELLAAADVIAALVNSL